MGMIQIRICGTFVWVEEPVSGLVDDHLPYTFHRTDGPAVMLPDGSFEWFLDDTYMTFEQWFEQSPWVIEQPLETQILIKLMGSDYFREKL